MSVRIWVHMLRSSCASVASSFVISPFRGRLRAAIFDGMRDAQVRICMQATRTDHMLPQALKAEDFGDYFLL